MSIHLVDDGETPATRSNDAVSVLHDRNPLYVRLADGSVRNAYTVRILNKSLEETNFVLKVEGLAGANVEVIGSSTYSGPNPRINVGPDQSREVRVLVTTREQITPHAAIPITLNIVPEAEGATAIAHDHFFGP